MNRKSIKDLIKKELSIDYALFNSYSIIKDLLTPLDGSPIDGNHFGRNKVDGYRFERIGVSQCVLRNIDNPKKSINIGEDGDIFNINKLDELNCSYSIGTLARIVKLEPFLTDRTKLDNLVQKFLKVQSTYKAFTKAVGEVQTSELESFNLPIHYNLLHELLPKDLVHLLIK